MNKHTVKSKYRTDLSTAQTDRGAQNLIEHRPSIRRRTRDDLEDLRRRRLMGMCFGSVSERAREFCVVG